MPVWWRLESMARRARTHQMLPEQPAVKRPMLSKATVYERLQARRILAKVTVCDESCVLEDCERARAVTSNHVPEGREKRIPPKVAVW